MLRPGEEEAEEEAEEEEDGGGKARIGCFCWCWEWTGAAVGAVGVKAEEAEGMKATRGGVETPDEGAPPPPPKGRAVLL